MNAIQKRGTLKQVIELLVIYIQIRLLIGLKRINQAIERPVNWSWLWHKSLAVTLSGTTIGFTFAMALILISANEPDIWGIVAIGTGLVLYMCLDRLYSDPLFILVGVIYLEMVGGVASTALFVQFPRDSILAVSIWEPSLYMLATLVCWYVFRQFVIYWIRLMRWLFGGMLHGKKQQIPAQGEETAASEA